MAYHGDVKTTNLNTADFSLKHRFHLSKGASTGQSLLRSCSPGLCHPAQVWPACLRHCQEQQQQQRGNIFVCEITCDSKNVPTHHTNLSNSHLCGARFLFLGGLHVKSHYNETVKEQSVLSAKLSKSS